MTTSNASEETNSSWLDRSLPPFLTNINIEKVIFAVIIILAIVSRFYILGARVMSHDEVNHVRPSWVLYKVKVTVMTRSRMASCNFTWGL